MVLNKGFALDTKEPFNTKSPKRSLHKIWGGGLMATQTKKAKMDGVSSSASTCVHHWIIDLKLGSLTSPGVCKKCKKRKVFLNYIPGDEREDGSLTMQRPKF